MRASIVLAAIAALGARAAPSQVVLDSSAPLSASRSSSSAELVVSSTEDGYWTTFKHGHFPGHSIRARRPNFCEHVEEWSGYLDVEQPHGAPTKHFYWRASAGHRRGSSAQTALRAAMIRQRTLCRCG